MAERIRKKEEEIKMLEERLLELERKSTNFNLNPEIILKTLRELTHHWSLLPVEKKNSLLKSILKEIKLFNDKAVLILFDDTVHELTLKEKRFIPEDNLPDHIKPIAQLYNQGFSSTQIARTLRLPLNRVKYTLSLLKKGKVPKRWGKTFSHISHLYQKEVLLLRGQGLSVAKIANLLGISQTTVWKIILDHEQDQLK